ncbi:phage-related integrase [Mycoavidus cysteinexigens]|uniref:Phage-related integrase n=1 Tax=Mycoavidus cysteinexigens TaxID=1553431 RepID=A0A2Z6EW56_9BURK|nr:tyrosine-type recombinase/integrase [Mycoavidus cysteinexigens]BBE09628.1 phage-related integrase [Mycoavidus cysteinexigens]GAM51615.1 integrase [bacterium endosymbiont of Mortierella elongata FMR23-6]GLR02232.1 integrase [Mycoavidus cysteinexigens]
MSQTAFNLPPRMRARVQRSGQTYYYYDTGHSSRQEIALGPDYLEALQKWTELDSQNQLEDRVRVTFRHAAQRYRQDVIPTKAPRTQKDNLAELVKLLEFFDNPPALMDEIKPIHIRQFLDWRVKETVRKLKEAGQAVNGSEGQVRANREKSLFSHIWNKAREWGYTDQPNPCLGIKGYREDGRKVYIEDSEYSAIYAKARQPLRDAMDLAYLTGQRPSDILKMTEQDIKEGCLLVQQNKTKTKLRIAITGHLEKTLERILKRKAKYNTGHVDLVVNELGECVALKTLQAMFAQARTAAGLCAAEYQFRDLRAKAGTDKAELSGDIRRAQKQLGHTSIKMTEHYVRNRRGEKVEPTK